MKLGFTFVRIAAGCAAIAVIIWRVDAGSVRDALADASVGWVAGAFAVNLLAILLSAMLWRGAITGTRPSLMQASRVYIAGVFFNNVGLGTAVGDAFRAQSLRERGLDAPSAIASVAVERIASLCALMLLASAGAAVIFGERPGLSVAVWAGSACIAFGLAASAVLVPRLRLPERLRAPLSETADAIRPFVRRPRAVLRAAALALLVQLCTIVATLLVLRAVGAGVSFAEALAIVPIIAFTVLVPVSVQGIGVRESAYVALFGIVGVAPETAVAAALLSYVTTLLVSLVGAAVVAYDVLAARKGDTGAGRIVPVEPRHRSDAAA